MIGIFPPHLPLNFEFVVLCGSGFRKCSKSAFFFKHEGDYIITGN